jgi:hypothetical protein
LSTPPRQGRGRRHMDSQVQHWLGGFASAHLSQLLWDHRRTLDVAGWW